MHHPFLRFIALATTGLFLATASPLSARSPEPARAALLAPQPAGAQAQAATPWLYRNSDIPVDAKWTFGELPNGLRYAVRRNGVPPGQVSIRVAIDAGSLMEREEERGYAHFLEHLSFRGSRHVADGEAKRTWQRLGATFGSDSNAVTSQTQTIYRLDLPQATDSALEDSLRILSGMIAAPTLTPAEVEAERRTVMAESRERDGAQVRSETALLQLFFAGQPLAERPPIGTTESLSKATSASLRAFHERWYRPDTTIISISGDADPEQIIALIKRHFSDWKPAAPGPLPSIDFGKPRADASTTAFVIEPQLPTSVSLIWLRPWTQKADTIALNQGRLIQIVAARIINRRLEQMARGGGSFLQAEIQQQDVARSADVTQVGITPLGQDWRGALADVRAVLAEAIARAPSQAEIDRETAEFKAVLDVQVETARAEASAKQADDIIEAVNIRETIASPEVARDVFSGMIGKFGPTEVQKATADMLSGIGPRAFVSSQVEEVDGAAALAQALAAPVMARQTRETSSVASLADLPKPGLPGTVLSSRTLDDLDVDVLTLSNGVRVLLGPSTSEAGRIYVSARFGHGMQSLPRDRLTPAWAANALAANGIGDLRQDDLERLTSGRQINLAISVGEDSFTMMGMTRPADLADQLRFTAAKFALPGWDAAPVLRTRAAAILGLQTSGSSPSDVIGRKLASLLRNGDKRWATPEKADAEALTPEAFRTFWEPVLQSGPIELSIFGDFDRMAVRAAISESFGALAPRPEAAPLRDSERVANARSNRTPMRLTHRGSPDQAVAVLSWPTGGGLEAVQTGRRLDMLAAIFADRLFEQFREGEGASYSPDVSSNWPRGFQSGGSFTVLAQVKPATLDAFFTRSRAIAADLASKPVSADELQRAVGPMLQRLSRASTGNAFWLSQLAGASREPQRAANVLRWRRDIESLTPADIQALARKYLKPDKGFTLVVVPDQAAARSQ